MELFILIVLSLGVYLLPGTFIVFLAGLEKFRFLYSYTLSLALFGFCLFLTGITESGRLFFSVIYLTILSILVALVMIKGFKKKPLLLLSESFQIPDIYAISGIFFLSICYFLWAGVYNELPSDFFRHMEFLKPTAAEWAQGNFSHGKISGINDKYWYYLYGMILNISGVSLSTANYWFSILNVTLFLIAFYLFAREFWHGEIWHEKKHVAVFLALFSVLLMVLHFGVAPFAYVRYYALAPTILMMPVYFLSVLVIQGFIEKRLDARYLLAVLSLLSASLYHIQEALFAVIAVSLLLFYYGLYSTKVFFNSDHATANLPRSETINLPLVRYGSLLIGLSIVIFTLYLALTTSRPTIDGNKLILLETILPFMRGLVILNPSYQFYQVIALWGCIGYLLFFFYFRYFRKYPYLLIGMVSPILTVFNPLFVDLFIRSAHIHVLYRLAYMLPIHMAVAYGLYISFQSLDRKNWTSFISPILFSALLIVTLFPFNSRYLENAYSRLDTLRPVDEEVSPKKWQDLIDYLNTLNRKEIVLTDPVTGYAISALTRHDSPRYRFTTANHISLNYPSYDHDPLGRYLNYLIVINQRDGDTSKTGELSGHWSKDIMKVSRYYSKALLDHLEQEKEKYTLLWQEDRIQIYRIR